MRQHRIQQYIGDGAYVEFDGHGLELTTTNGLVTTNRIYLEPEVWAALESFVGRIKKGGAPSATDQNAEGTGDG